MRMMDLGGGFGVVQNPTAGDRPLPVSLIGETLQQFKAAHVDVELWVEPGRYVIADAGVLLSKVTQIKEKGDSRYVGVDSGFNSLIRPMLYSAYHHIVNLTSIDAPCEWTASVVGMICESGDIFGQSRPLPVCVEDDVLLIDTAGAYARSMASHYNIRDPAREHLLSD